MHIRRVCFALALAGAAAAAMAQRPEELPAPKSPAAAGAATHVAPNEVVATINGEKFTAGQIERVRASLPPQFAAAASRMDNRSFVKSYAELIVLARRAEEEKMPEREPYKGQLEFMRTNFLAQTYLNTINQSVRVSPEEIEQYYEQHKADYQEATVKAIYIAFSPNAAQQAPDAKGKKALTEEQAKAKAEGLAQQLKQGADFAVLAKENSDDASTAAKGGDMGGIRKGAPGVPNEIKNAVFALRPGEISSPLRQPAGYYIFRLEGFRDVPASQVNSEINAAVMSAKVKAEMDKIIASIQVTYDNEQFFNQPPPGGPMPKAIMPVRPGSAPGAPTATPPVAAPAVPAK